MQVMLTESDSEELRHHIYTLLVEEVQKVKNDASIDHRILNQQQIADYFGVSATTIRAWEGLGLPHGTMGAQSKFYDKEECRKWVLSQKR